MSTLERVELRDRRRSCRPVAWAFCSLSVAVAAAGGASCWAQARPTGLDAAALQREADYRVVAARCSTPAFEKNFYVQSQDFVAASNGHDRESTARQESAIRSMRRNPIALIGSQTDCKLQGARLKQIMDERNRGRTSRRSRDG